jgi:5'(3')-deoxyribonucleotidase
MDEKLNSYLIRMHQIINLPEYNNCGIVAQHLVEMMTEFGVSLPEANKLLREVKSRVYLIGLPLSFYKDNDAKTIWLTEPIPISEYSAFIPGSKKTYAYGLWICMNGEEEYKNIIKEIKNSDIELTNTGFLTK